MPQLQDVLPAALSPQLLTLRPHHPCTGNRKTTVLRADTHVEKGFVYCTIPHNSDLTSNPDDDEALCAAEACGGHPEHLAGVLRDRLVGQIGRAHV